MATTEFIERVFERAKAVALEAVQRRKFQDVSLTVTIRGGEAFEAKLPDGEYLRPARPITT